MFVGAYWQQRKESREEVAGRVTRFLSDLGARNALFSKWFSKGRSKAAAGTPIVMDASGLAGNLKVNRRDVGGDVMPELGFTLGIWNGDGVSMQATAGAYNPYVRNSVVLSFDTVEDRLTKADWKVVLEAVIGAFDPEHAVVTSADYMTRHQPSNPWDAGWFTYSRGVGVREHPFEN
jgi:hypothetical protein